MLDSNVFFSALVSPTGLPFLVVQAWLKGNFELVSCEPQIEEIRRVSRYEKFRTRLKPNEIGNLVNQMKLHLYAGAIPRIHPCDDPEDAYLLDLTDASQADYLVTGDRRAAMIGRRRVGRASIVTVKSFAEELYL